MDLHCEFTAVGKQRARTQGLYSQRRTFQIRFAGGIATSGLILSTRLRWTFRRLWRQYGLALFGIAFLVTFVIIRAASFHPVDEFPGGQPAGSPVNSILEIGAITRAGTRALIGILRGARQTAKTAIPHISLKRVDDIVLSARYCDTDGLHGHNQRSLYPVFCQLWA